MIVFIRVAVLIFLTLSLYRAVLNHTYKITKDTTYRPGDEL